MISSEAKHRYKFGNFLLDTEERLLLREGKAVPLTVKAYDLLLLLVQHPGHLLEREELLRSLWPDRFVEEANLTVNIATLRKALGERADGEHYIETIPKRGYRFLPNVEEVAAASVATTPFVEVQIVQPHQKSESPVATVAVADATQTTNKKPLRFLYPAVAMAAVLLLSVGFYFWNRKQPQQTEVKAIAVLPFKSLTPGQGDEHGDAYLGLGIADALITSIGNLPQIIVRPTNAVRAYAMNAPDPLVAGRALQVDAVLEGSVQQVGERIRVTARLVKITDGQSLWSGKFDEHFKDVFTLQDSICERVVSALALHLTSAERGQIAKRSTENPEAYQLYMKGRYLWNLRTQASLRKAAEYFQQAIEKDPSNAMAYASLAQCYTLLPPQEGFIPKTRAAATKALELDSSLAEAHAALAHPSIFYEWDWATGERELKKALEINPNYATARQWYALYLTAMGRLAEALSEMKHAQALDPISLVINTHLGNILYHSRQYDQAVEQYQKTLELDPNFALAQVYLGYTYLEKARYEESIAAFQKAVSQGIGAENLGYGYGRWGKREEARKILASLKQRGSTPSKQALVYLGLGEKEQTLQLLQKACVEEKPFWFIYLNVDPRFDGLRDEPRFQALLQCVGLTSSQQAPVTAQGAGGVAK